MMTVKVAHIPQTAMIVPLYTSMELYPMGPINHFPPPLPTRQSLRSRCGVTMHLQLSTHGLVGPMAGWSPKVHVQPHRNNLPRRRNAKRLVLNDHDEAEPPTVTEVKVAVESPKAQKVEVVAPIVHRQPHRNNLPRRRNVRRIVLNDTDEDDAPKVDMARSELASSEQEPAHVISHLPPPGPYVPAISSDNAYTQLLVPGVTMAFADVHTELDQLPVYTANEPYTHIVRVGYGDEDAVEWVTEGKTQNLLLRLPSLAGNSGTVRAGLGLSDTQLLTARDFMAEALPRLSLAQRSPGSGVRLLVTGPRGHPTDVVCVATCYLAFLTGKSMEDILRFIDAEDEFLSVYKGEVSDDEAEKVEKIARA